MVVDRPKSEAWRDAEIRPLKDRRIPVMMTSEEVAAIDNWMFERRIRTRAGAIRALISEGLKATGETA